MQNSGIFDAKLGHFCPKSMALFTQKAVGFESNWFSTVYKTSHSPAEKQAFHFKTAVVSRAFAVSFSC